MSIEYQNAITLDSSGKTKETNIAVKSGKLRIEVIRQDQHLRTYTPQHDTIRLATWKCGMENGLGCLHATQRKQFSHAQQLHWSQFASAPYEKPVVYVVGQTVKDDSCCFKFPKCSKSIQISSLNMHSIQSIISSATCQTCQLTSECLHFAWLILRFFRMNQTILALPDGLQPRSGSPAWSAGSDFRRSRRLVSTGPPVWKWKTIDFRRKVANKTSWNRLRRIIISIIYNYDS